MASELYWLKCEATPGQFSDELAISSHDFRGEKFSLFVPLPQVKIDEDVFARAHRDSDAMIRVEILDRKDSLVLIKLPCRAFGNGSTLTVNIAQLVSGELMPH
jgi:hypothetical protein